MAAACGVVAAQDTRDSRNPATTGAPAVPATAGAPIDDLEALISIRRGSRQVAKSCNESPPIRKKSSRVESSAQISASVSTVKHGVVRSTSRRSTRNDA